MIRTCFVGLVLALPTVACNDPANIGPDPSAASAQLSLQGLGADKRVLTASTEASRLRTFFITPLQSDDQSAQLVEHLIDGPFVITSTEFASAFVDLGGDCSYDPTVPPDDEFVVTATTFVPVGSALCAIRYVGPYQRSYVSGYIPY